MTAKCVLLLLMMMAIAASPGVAQQVNPSVDIVPLPRAVAPEPLPPGDSLSGLTLAQLEEMAQRCNPTLAQAAAQIDAARGQYIQAGLYPNPVIGYQATEIGDEGRGGQQGGFLGQEIVTAGKLARGREVACQEIRQAELAWQTQRFRVLTDVRRAFYDVLVAQRSMEVTHQLVGIGQQGVKATEALMQAKEVARADVLQAKIEADSATILLERAQNRHAAAWRSLASVVGDPTIPPSPLVGELSDGMANYTWDDTLARLLSESPQLAEAQAGVARAQAVLGRACAERYPNLDIQAGMQYDNATQDRIVGVQAGVPIPIYNRNQGNIYRAQSELTAAQREVARVRLALQQRLAAVFERYDTARQQVDTYARDILPNAEESLNLVSSGYRQGEFGYLMLLTAQRTYFQTSLAYLDSLRELRSATAMIEGNLLCDSLESVGSVSNRN